MNSLPLPVSTAHPFTIDRADVGNRLRRRRKASGLTLKEVSLRSGVTLSMISKAERGDVALTYDKFAALAQALGMDFGDLFGEPAASDVSGEISLTRAGEQVVYRTDNYVYGMLAADLTGKQMIPMRATINARSIADFPDYIRHPGEEFVYLLAGTLKICFADGREFSLHPGDSLYFNSGIGHLYLAAGEGNAEAIVLCTQDTARQDEGII
jgi:transcriptional regulator with XRE-family HTH domain